MADVYLTDLIDIETLQQIQDAFSKMTGMAALTTDENGIAVTQGSNFTDYCMHYTRTSKVGCERCENCDKFGAVTTMRTGKATTYMCHSGLLDFAAPILAKDKLIGCFIGGQILTERPDPVFIQKVASDIGVNFDEYWTALQKVPIRNKEEIDKAADFLHTISSVLSNMAYGQYQALIARTEMEKAAQEIEHAASMKDDFLANMSHEIRTPMNAVIGLAEMALREELPQTARDYILQIKASGRSLLNIINDILDYSKIESGKMDIVRTEYEPLSSFNDVANIIMTRINDKDVEFLLEINPKFPCKLYGDVQRFRQILINLANNAIKFTEHGQVCVNVDFEPMDEEMIMMKVSIKDTGIGIKKEDLKKLFRSFQQVDSKRNRNIEGTGLGLAISKQLLELMDGQIHVESIYEKGSTFSFELPQKVLDWKPCIVARDVENLAAVGYFQNKHLAKQFFKDTNNLSVFSMAMIGPEYFENMLKMYKQDIASKRLYVFIEEACYTEVLDDIVKEHEDIIFVLLVDFFSNRKPDKKNLRIIKKPLSVASIATTLNNEEYHRSEEDDSYTFDFVAPTAKILIVDDNEINLTVAEGLLEPLKMNIQTATGGRKAFELIEKNHFDLILMDHMMPEIDGVEATRIIRRLYESYNDVPIIALTANAVDGTKEMFLSEGMNDFVSKPIEVRTLVATLKQWLPIEKIEKINGVVAVSDINDKEVEIPTIEDLDVATAVKLLGSVELFYKLLKEYYKAIPNKVKQIRGFFEKSDWPAYTIEVHSLKSLSHQVGAIELSDMAAELEKAGNSRNTHYIRKFTEPMLDKYLEYETILKPFCFEEEENTSVKKKLLQPDELEKLFQQMRIALDDLDMNGMEDACNKIGGYFFEAKQAELYDKLKEAVENIDVELCDVILGEWETVLEG